MIENKPSSFYLSAIAALVFSLNIFAVDNPINYNAEITDCDVFKYNGEYYITGNWLAGDMYRSRNLEDWGERTHIFSWNNSWHTPNHTPQDYDIHAGHIRYYNGVFHFYTQLEPKQGVNETYSITHATADNPWGPYTEVSDAPFAENIDAETFLDEDGSFHFYSTRFGGVSNNHNDYRPMLDPYTLTGSYSTMIWPTGGWEINPELPEFSPPNYTPKINEGPQIFKYRSQYYMLYNANHTGDTSYAIGCTQASSPTGFSNSGKYASPLLSKITPPGSDEIAYIGQPWVVDGVNGFEKWCGYFGQTASEGRTQRIDRMHFFDRHLFIDGPTNRYTTGYHPGPARPQLLSLFYLPDGPMPASDWTHISGTGQWEVLNEQAYQSSQNCFSFNLVNRDASTNYLIEANVKMTAARDSEDKAGVLAYYQDEDNWIIVGFDRSLGYGADNWYCHVKENNIDTIYSGGYGGSLDYSVYHKIRVTKNGGNFDIRIDDMIPPSHTTITTGFTGVGTPGIYSNHAPAVYDGVIYTIGWDEYDSGLTGWGDNVNGFPSAGIWSVASDGITMSNGAGYIFKGDLMPEYEFATQVYKVGTTDGLMGMLPVVIDGTNYVYAQINTATNQLIVGAVKNGSPIAEQSVSVTDAISYNIRSVKLADKVILFVDGQEAMTYNVSFGAAQVGLIVNDMSARFNGIMTYRVEPQSIPAQWMAADVGSVGFAGSADYNEETFTVNGSGQDIWYPNADGFHYVYQDLYGNGEIVARVISLDATDWWAKAGITIRSGLSGNDNMANVVLCSNGQIQLGTRTSVGNGSVIDAPGSPFTGPVWLKLVRSGNNFYGYHSADGNSWTFVGSKYVNIPQYAKIGLCVTSHNNTRVNGGVFDNVSITGCTPGDLETDLSRDCVVDLDDFVMLADTWLDDVPIDTPEDFDDSLHIDLVDFSILASDWLKSYDD